MTAATMRTQVVDGAPISFCDTGTGQPVVFVHGVYVTGALWDDVIEALEGQVRCIVPTWPLGAHDPVPDDVDLSVAATARRIVGLVDVLDLHGVTLVANDTGGGLVLAALGDPALDFSRIGGLVLTNCDSYEHFPPRSFAPLASLCRVAPWAGRAALRGLASGFGQRFFIRAVTRLGVGSQRRRALFGPFVTNAATRRQAAEVTASLDPSLTLRSTDAIRRFSRRVTIVWGRCDRLFPVDHARRLVSEFPDARLIEVADSSTYVMLDAPEVLAAAIRDVADNR
jgi:pimeloyl-ACP methyl ester carboxylesterase